MGQLSWRWWEGLLSPGMTLRVTFARGDLPNIWLCIHGSRGIRATIQRQRFLAWAAAQT